MCITIPVKIIKIEKNQAWGEARGRKIRFKLTTLSKVKKGDWVLIYGDLALRKISSKEAKEIIKELQK